MQELAGFHEMQQELLLMKVWHEWLIDSKLDG